MDSINRHRIRQRISGIYDTAAGAQGTSKYMKEYVKGLERAVDIQRESAGNAADFARDFGAGI